MDTIARMINGEEIPMGRFTGLADAISDLDGKLITNINI